MSFYVALSLAVLSFALNSSPAMLESPEGPTWDFLQVSFPPNNVNPPLTTTDAEKGNWIKDSSCGDGKYFKGNRYLKGNDKSVMPLYDSNGKIAGYQMGVPAAAVGPKKSPWVLEGGHYVITVYLVDPKTICDGTRPTSKYIGDRIVLQLGTCSKELMSVPLTEDKLKGTKWIKGTCFKIHGQHYWYNISADMKCDDIFPLNLSYNKGRLASFFIAVGKGDLKGTFERPTGKQTALFFVKGTWPKCLASYERLNTQHVFLGSPLKNGCQ